MKLTLKFILGVCITISILSYLLYYGLNLMAIEDKYGEFQELYYKIDKSDNYFVIIDNKEVGFVQKLDDEIYVTVEDCMKHLLNYLNNNVEVYQFEVNKTYTHFSLKDAMHLKNESKTELIFKN